MKILYILLLLFLSIHYISADGTHTHTDLKGPKGDKGDKGDPGPIGPSGGEKGDTGPKGETGDIGPKGEEGDHGHKGDKGDKGDQGPKGEQGPIGVGATGPQGDKGDKGPKGDKGDASTVAGPQGLRGEKGDTGEKGAVGQQADMENLYFIAVAIFGCYYMFKYTSDVYAPLGSLLAVSIYLQPFTHLYRLIWGAQYAADLCKVDVDAVFGFVDCWKDGDRYTFLVSSYEVAVFAQTLLLLGLGMYSTIVIMMSSTDLRHRGSMTACVIMQAVVVAVTLPLFFLSRDALGYYSGPYNWMAFVLSTAICVVFFEHVLDLYNRQQRYAPVIPAN